MKELSKEVKDIIMSYTDLYRDHADGCFSEEDTFEDVWGKYLGYIHFNGENYDHYGYSPGEFYGAVIAIGTTDIDSWGTGIVVVDEEFNIRLESTGHIQNEVFDCIDEVPDSVVVNLENVIKACHEDGSIKKMILK